MELPGEPDPDPAWRGLLLVNDWIRHGDAKIGVTLALSGAAGAILFNLVKGTKDPDVFLKIAGVATALVLTYTAFCAVVGLIPQTRIRGKRESEAFTSLLFYAHIAQGWKGQPKEFSYALARLTTDKQKLTLELGEQMWANAKVAHRKFTWADRAVKGLAISLLLLAITSIARLGS